MAQRTQIILEDDIDGGPADETVRFSFRGDEYEIDLSKQNVAQLRDAMEPFMRNGRKVSGQRRSRSDRPTSTNSDKAAELRAMREWARANGHTVSDKGRVSQSIQDAYRAAR